MVEQIQPMANQECLFSQQAAASVLKTAVCIGGKTMNLTACSRPLILATALMGLCANSRLAVAESPEEALPEPVPAVTEPALSVTALAERLERLEAENSSLQAQIDGLQHNRPATTIVQKRMNKYLNSSRPAGIIANVDYLRWAYRQPGTEYGITDIGGVQDRGAVGSVLSIDGEYDNGIRATIGYRFDRGNCNCILDRPEILFSFTEFDTELFDQRIGPLRATFISSDNSENDDSDNINTLGVETITPDDRATSATARLTLDYDVYDLEFAQTLQLTPSLTWRLSGGARATVINERFDVTYTGGDFQVPYRAFRDWDYSGGGAMVGSVFNWSAPYGFSVNVGAKGGLVLGRYQSRYFFPDDEPGVPTDVRHSETRVNPFLEVSGGVQYQREIGDCLLTLGAGYELVNWFNMADNRTFTDSHIEGQNVNTVRDLSLDGMYARVGINY